MKEQGIKMAPETLVKQVKAIVKGLDVSNLNAKKSELLALLV